MIIKFYNHAHRLSHTHRGRGAGPGRGPPARRAAARPRAPAVASESPPGHLRAVFRGFVCRRGPVRPRAGRGGAGARGGFAKGGREEASLGRVPRARAPPLCAVSRVFLRFLHPSSRISHRLGETGRALRAVRSVRLGPARASSSESNLGETRPSRSSSESKSGQTVQKSANARIEAAPPAQSRPQLAHPGCNARTAVQ